MIRRNLLLTAATLPFAASCASKITQQRERPVAELAKELGVCSAVYSVLRAGTPLAPIEVSGCNNDTAKASAIFQAASLTKPVVAYAALRLALAGQLDIHAAVSRYLPNGYKHFRSVLARAPSDSHDIVPSSVLSRITAAQLLNHSGGLPNWSSGTLAFKSKPGERWGYSGEGFVLLQAVIEAVTGKDIASYMDEQVFAALGMTDSSLIWQEAFAQRAVSGTRAFGFQPRVQFKSAVAAASLYTTAADYARFMSALLSNDQLLSLILSKPIGVDAALGLQWGLGWGIERAPGGPYIWQWGNNPGFRAFAMASATSKDGFVILTNSEKGMPLAASVAQSVLPAEHNAFRFSLVA
jgi:CubicO group peptidase (beta-lactamase class C family)